jgi:hypothetical protein
MPDITLEDGRLITGEALAWKGTVYALVGDRSIKGHSGDCSGSTNKIYSKAGFSYEYRSVATFEAYAGSSRLFRKLRDDEQKQDGDILLWEDHMAIYSTFSAPLEAPFRTTARVNKQNKKEVHWTQVNDMWTASHTGGPAYGAGASKYWKDDAPDSYRFVKSGA